MMTSQDTSVSANPAPLPAEPVLRIGRWQIDPSLNSGTLDGKTIAFAPRTMRLLVVLAEAAGRTVTNDHLLRAVWPGLIVTPNSIHQAIAELRRVLAMDVATDRFIASVPRKGYRLVAPMETGSLQSATADPRSLAVLPFTASGLPDSHEFMRVSLLADLIGALSREPQLRVIARGTMQTFESGVGVNPQQIARELGVSFVVDGRIVCSDGRLQISAELIDGESSRQIWSESVEVGLDEWAHVARVVVGRLCRVLQIGIIESAAKYPRSGSTPPDAVELSMKAWLELYGRPQAPKTNVHAWALALKALEMDSRLAVAWNALAYAKWRAAQYGWHAKSRGELLDEAMLDVQRAIELEPSDPDAHYTLALISHLLPAGYERSEASLRHCLALNPSYAPAHGLLAIVRTLMGFPQEAAMHCERAFALSPREPLRAVWYWALSWAEQLQGNDQTALTHALQGIALNPEYPSCHLSAAIASWRLENWELAHQSVAVLKKTRPFDSIKRVVEHLPQFRHGTDGERFLTELRAAGLPEC